MIKLLEENIDCTLFGIYLGNNFWMFPLAKETKGKINS